MGAIQYNRNTKWEKVVKMFFGSFEHSLDEKNRLLIPAKLRNTLGTKLFIMKGYEGSLSIYPNDQFVKFLNKLQSLPYESKVSRDIERISLSSVFELEIDRVNRIQIPTALINKYSISKEVVVVGVIDHIEVWSKAKWEKYLEDNEAEYEQKSEELLKNV